MSEIATLSITDHGHGRRCCPLPSSHVPRHFRLRPRIFSWFSVIFHAIAVYKLGAEGVTLLLEGVDAPLMVDQKLRLVVDGHVHVEREDCAVRVVCY